MRPWTVIPAALLVLGPAFAQLKTDPARDLARVRLIVSTTAGTTDVTVAGATIASYTSTILDGAPGSAASQTGHVMRTTNGAAGNDAEAQFDIILQGVRPGNQITWTIDADGPADVHVDEYSTTQPDNPRLVDRLDVSGTTARLTTAAALLASSGAVAVTPIRPRLVIAQYYPWYETDTWNDAQLADQPQPLYSTDNPADIDRQTQQALGSGIDAFAVSWQGPAPQVAWNDRRVRLVLDAARRAGTHACVYFETYVANPTNDPNLPTDPDTVIHWLEDAVDFYGGHPAYLRVDGRPVIFVYWASRLTEADWAHVLAAVRATGRNPIVIGDFYHSRLINVLDGEYQYINVFLSPGDLAQQNLTETLRVRTFNLLRTGDRRRIWVASVCPGYDDRRLKGRDTPHFVDRANGSVYDTQWDSAVSTAADWVIITTWNEWWENTQIEPSAKYGRQFLDRTRYWIDKFKAPSARRRSPAAGQ